MKVFTSILALAVAGTQVAEGRYFYFQGYDSPGGQMRVLSGLTIQRLKQWCSERRRCVGFNTYGIMKKSFKPRTQWKEVRDPEFYTYIKNEASIPPDSYDGSYEIYRGWSIDHNNIVQLRGEDVDDLRKACTGRKKCTAFKTNGWLKQGYVPQKEWNYVGEENSVLYIKGRYRNRAGKKFRHDLY
jgi:hypothetical protein